MSPHTPASAPSSGLRDFFPPIEPHAKGMLQVDDLHNLYWEECGNPKGVPVVFLHGGPGAGATPTHRRFFNPDDWRIIIFDQRGAGRSRPLGETRLNTTELLVQDIETLRQHRGVERWHVFGGSWGSTLALSYAQTHPERCLGLILRGICLLQKREIDWFLYGIRNIFPEAWAKFANVIPAEERHDLLSAYIKIFDGPDEQRRMEAIRAWAGYESTCSTLCPGPEGSVVINDDQHRIGLARIEAHYFKNNLFTPDDQLLRHADKLHRIPGFVVHGRYDVICPILAMEELRQCWPQAEYRIIPDAGHSALEPGIRAALIEATEKFKILKG
ncbi:MAG: prolyl aminopeptidase [Alphaproteobacteria bacterium]|nr:prolyl aminopeptidase [Alphaproteobacteria bacterium]